MDFGMGGCSDVFAFIAELFEQFFAGTQAGKFDSNILIWDTPGKLNQLASEVQNFDRFAHVQQENLSTKALSGTLKNQSYSLGYGHEVASDVGVSDFDGSPSGNLFVKERDDTAG